MRKKLTIREKKRNKNRTLKLEDKETITEKEREKGRIKWRERRYLVCYQGVKEIVKERKKYKES